MQEESDLWRLAGLKGQDGLRVRAQAGSQTVFILLAMGFTWPT